MSLPAPPGLPSLASPVQTYSAPALNTVLVPLVSPSQWTAYPTALAGSNLVPGGTDAQQTMALAQFCRQATTYADEHVYGTLPYGSPPGFSARYVTEVRTTTLTSGLLRLYSRNNPVLALTNYAWSIGGGQAAPIALTSNVQAWIEGHVVTIPFAATQSPLISSTRDAMAYPSASEGSRITSYWTYLGGYPHTALAASATAGQTSLTLATNTTSGEIAGLSPGVVLRIEDYTNGPESVVVDSVSGAVVALSGPLAYDHPLPTAPDFTPVTSVPQTVSQATLFLVSALVLNRGMMPLALSSLSSPSSLSGDAGQAVGFLTLACDALDPFKQLL